MATVTGRANTSYTLGSAQTGNGDTTDTLDRRYFNKALPCSVELVSTVGATPTVTLQLLGSQDGTTWYKIPYCLVATPETIAVADLTITSAVTTVHILRANHPWRYLKATRSANTNVTLTVKVHL